MMGDWDEEEYDDRSDDECECIETELDILTGVDRCWSCGRTRMLGGDEFSRRLKQEAEWAEAYHEEIERQES
jgi:hypothetical protein